MTGRTIDLEGHGDRAGAERAVDLPTAVDTLRVCHLIHSLRDGGAEHVLVTMAEVAATAGLELSVVSLMPDQDLRYARQLRELGVTVRSLSLGTRWDGRALPRAVRLVRELRPDVVHTHLKHADLVGAFVASRLAVPMVSTLHVIEDAPDPVRRFKRRVAAQARLRGARRTITVSDAQRRWYLETFRADADRVTTVRNGVLPAARATGVERAHFRATHGVPEGTVLAAMVALLRPGKGHDDLFDAVRRLPSDLEVRVLVAGDGPLRNELEAEVAGDARLRGRIVFAGFIEDVEGLFASCDLVVHPSHFDALPTALIYAIAAGVPVIASDVGGIPEIVGEGAGVLVPAHDAPALAGAIETLVNDRDQRSRLGAAGRERFQAEFDARGWAGRLRSVYESALAEQRGR
jgi:glycosyltransferase involved in cell wall biosynthesis